MATVFISYQHLDENLARGIEQRLKGKGHVLKIAVGAWVSGNWRLAFLKALVAADAIILLLTDNGLRSDHVLGQIGSARVLAHSKDMLILPVIARDAVIPDMVGDLSCFRLAGPEQQHLDQLTEQLHKAISASMLPPRVFISHRHEDEPVAAALVDLIEAAFDVRSADIRCTSLARYGLAPGVQVSERLRHDVVGAQLVMGLIGPNTAESGYVLFELGASWACRVPTFPLLIRGASADDIPGPLAERKAVSLDRAKACLQLIENIAAETTLKRREGAAEKIAAEADKLARIAARRRSGSAVPSKSR